MGSRTATEQPAERARFLAMAMRVGKAWLFQRERRRRRFAGWGQAREGRAKVRRLSAVVVPIAKMPNL